MDKRADIWAFGVVLCEMLTGQRLFEGETISHTLADVLRGAYRFSEASGEYARADPRPAARCLDRDVKIELRDIGEARVAD